MSDETSRRCSSGPTSCADWACAPTPTPAADATRAREFGAEGIGLCRTEHMFMGTDHQPQMRAMIMAESDEERAEALDELLPLQQEDFEGLFEAMEGLPVTIRLLDPPLHEFLPNAEELAQEVERARIEESDELEELEHTLERVHAWRRPTPCSAPAACGWPSCTRRSARCRWRRSSAPPRRARAQRRSPLLEIMVPLVAYEQELELHARADRAGGGGQGRQRPGADDRDHDRAAAGVLRGRPDRASRPTSSRSAPTT